MTYIFLILLILIMSASASQKGCGIKCFSSSCRYNQSGRCRRREITIYDNTVTGLCLNHTGSMRNRVVEPIMKSELFNSDKHEICVTVGSSKKTQEEVLDEKLLKNPNAFARWMRKQSKLKQ